MIPEVGKTYHFFDDGKIRESRHYLATITEVYEYSDSKLDEITSNFRLEEGIYTLRDAIQNEQDRCDWLFNKITDYVVKADIPEYDEYPIFFIRTKDNGWFSIDFYQTWQGGRLDIDGSRWNWLQKEIEEYERKRT